MKSKDNKGADMRRSDFVRERILAAVTKQIEHHKFSEKAMPLYVQIKTVYPESVQLLTLDGEDIFK